MWSSPRAIGAGRESSGTAGRPCRPSGPSPIARESSSNPRARRPEHEWPRSACRHRGPSDPPASGPGVPVDLVGHRTGARVAGESWSTPQALEHGPRSAETSGKARRTSGMGPSLPGEVVFNAGHRPERESPGSAGGHRGPSEKSASHPGELVDLAGPRNRARKTGTAGRSRGPSDPSASRPGELVDHAGPRTIGRVAPDIWSTPRYLGP